MSPAEQYARVAQLIQEQPDTGDLQNVFKWAGRGLALARSIDPFSTEAAQISAIISGSTMQRDHWAAIQSINTALYVLLAAAELRAPVSDQGAFIAAASPFDALNAVAKVLTQATRDLLIVDPYMDEKALTDFAVLAAEGISLQLLADKAYVKPSFTPAYTRFVQQYGAKRPAEARLTAAKQLHDRLIVVDGRTAYTMTQSLNGLAARSPASLARVGDEIASMKIPFYKDLWQAGSPIT